MRTQSAHLHTHTPFSQRPGITWTSCSPFPGFPFGRPNPKYPPPDHPGGAGSKTIDRNPITCTKVLLSPFFFGCSVPPMKRPSGPRPADTERTPTHTHTVFPRPGITWTFPLSSPGFSLWPPESQVPAAGSPGRRGFENHRPKTDNTYKSFPFPVLLRVLCTHDTPHTYLHSLSPLAITIAL